MDLVSFITWVGTTLVISTIDVNNGIDEYIYPYYTEA